MIATVAGNGTAGFSGDNGLATAAQLNGPNDVSLDGDANLYICDAVNNRIRKVAAATNMISTIVGNGRSGFTGDAGPAVDAQINSPVGAIIDTAGKPVFLGSRQSANPSSRCGHKRNYYDRGHGHAGI
jgi:hypothetical protein